MESESDRAPLIVIVGETASGKSALAHALALRFNGEVIAADSWAVYKGFDIGTAKPTIRERAKVPYYLLDVADPRAGFSAVEFQRQAFKAIRYITLRGKLPVLTGGTGLYVDSVIFDYGFLPGSKPGVREQLNQLSLSELQAKAAISGLNLEGIDMRNKRRIIRLIENNGMRPTRQDLRENTLIIGIKIDSEELKKRVERRVDEMLASGLREEVRMLAGTYGWDVEPMKGIGYREFCEYFQGSQNLQQTRDRIVAATLNLAKRQRTWFKRNKSIHWVTTERALADSVDLVTTFLNK